MLRLLPVFNNFRPAATYNALSSAFQPLWYPEVLDRDYLNNVLICTLLLAGHERANGIDISGPFIHHGPPEVDIQQQGAIGISAPGLELDPATWAYRSECRLDDYRS